MNEDVQYVQAYEYKGKVYKSREEALESKYRDLIINRFTQVIYDRGFKIPKVNLTAQTVLLNSDWLIDTLRDYTREKHGHVSLGTLPSEPRFK